MSNTVVTLFIKLAWESQLTEMLFKLLLLTAYGFHKPDYQTTHNPINFI